MAYNIKLLNNHTIGKKNYFFDANIWLMILKPSIDLSDYQLKYLDFVQKFMKSANSPRIVVPALVLSEVINRYLREVGMNKFAAKNKIKDLPKGYYKEVYRSSSQFKIDYKVLCDDIKVYDTHYDLISDKFGIDFTSEDILSDLPQGLDFNDYYYYLLAKKEGYSIVTDDVDFFVEGVEVLTYNSKLYKKGTDSIKPKFN